MNELNNFTRFFKNVKNSKDLNWQEKAILSEIISYQLDGKPFKLKDTTLAVELAMDKGTISKLIGRLSKKGFIDKYTVPFASPNGGKPKRLRTVTVKDIDVWTKGSTVPKTKIVQPKTEPTQNEVSENKHISIAKQKLPAAAKEQINGRDPEQTTNQTDLETISIKCAVEDNTSQPSDLVFLDEKDVSINRSTYDHIIKKMQEGTRYNFKPVQVKYADGNIGSDEAMKEPGMVYFALKSKLMKINAEIFN